MKWCDNAYIVTFETTHVPRKFKITTGNPAVLLETKGLMVVCYSHSLSFSDYYFMIIHSSRAQL